MNWFYRAVKDKKRKPLDSGMRRNDGRGEFWASRGFFDNPIGE